MQTRFPASLRRLGIAVAVLASAFAPARALAQAPTAVVAPVEVTLPVPPAKAFDQVMAAFVALGYTPDQASRDAGTIKSLPQPQGTTRGITSELFFRAVILPADSGSRVMVSATGRGTFNMRGQMQTTPEVPLSECATSGFAARGANEKCAATLLVYKAKIQALADRIRAGA